MVHLQPRDPYRHELRSRYFLFSKEFDDTLAFLEMALISHGLRNEATDAGELFTEKLHHLLDEVQAFRSDAQAIFKKLEREARGF